MLSQFDHMTFLPHIIRLKLHLKLIEEYKFESLTLLYQNNKLVFRRF